MHFDKRTYTLKGDSVSLYTLDGRITVGLLLGAHQRHILESGRAKEAELVLRKGRWFFNLVVEADDVQPLASDPVAGVDVGENNLAATSLGKVYGGARLRHERDKYLALRCRLQANGSQSAKQKLRQVSGKERRRVKHINHETSKSIVETAVKAGVAKTTMEDLTHIRARIKAGRRMRARRHRFVCETCGLRAHSDLNASRNLARIGSGAPLSRAAVDTPDVGSAPMGNHVCTSQ